MRKLSEKLSYLVLLPLAILAGCFTSGADKPSGPILLEDVSPQISEAEEMIAKDKGMGKLIQDITGQAEPKEIPETVSFEKGDWVHYKQPYPSYQPVYAVWNKGEKEVQRSLAYHGWDLNFDGRLDMFEGVDLEGVTYIKLFDYNFDGKVDHVEKLELVTSASDELETLEVK